MNFTQATAFLTLLCIAALMLNQLRITAGRIDSHRALEGENEDTAALAAESIAFGLIVLTGALAIFNPVLVALGIL